MHTNFKLFCFSIFATFLLFACSSSDGPNEMEMEEEEMEEELVFPESFTKKILFEKISTEPCGTCPSASNYMKDYIDTIENVLAVSIQVDDGLAIPYNKDLLYYLAQPGSFLGYPEFSINRIYPENSQVAFIGILDWGDLIQSIDKEATLGLALESKVTGDLLDIEVKIASLENENSSKLTVYLYEEDHPEATPGSQVNGGGTAASPYLHHNLLVDVVTEEFNFLDKVGDDITVTKNEFLVKNYTGIDISTFNRDKLHVLAFVHRDNDPFNLEIANLQYAKIGVKKDFD